MVQSDDHVFHTPVIIGDEIEEKAVHFVVRVDFSAHVEIGI
jgi:hypothetical protein